MKPIDLLEFGRIARLACLGLTVPLLLQAQARRPTSLERTGFFNSSRFRESSGVAVSRQYPGILWTHNDSGDGPYLMVTNLRGQYLGRYRVRGAENRDWEDLALAPCAPAEDLEESITCLYIADTGNNRSRDHELNLYLVPEPDPNDEPEDEDRRTEKSIEIELDLPGDPVDIEAMAVSPERQVYFFSKGREGRIFAYYLEPSELLEDKAEAQLLDGLDIAPSRMVGRLVTGAAISPSGNRLAIRTYTEVYLYRFGPRRSLVREGPPCWIGALEPQGEAIDFLDEATLVLTSESVLNHAGMIHTLKCGSGAP